MAYCQVCDRSFQSEKALDQHLSNSRRHAFDCRFCGLHFETQTGYDDHVRDSPDHNICGICGEDLGTGDELFNHELEIHNMCEECFKYFSSPNNLNQVS